MGLKPVLVHDPVRFLAIGCPSFVEDEGFPHADELCPVVHRLISSRRLPKPRHRRPVGPRPRRVLLIFVAEEIPLVLLFVSNSTFFCSQDHHHHIYIYYYY